MFVLPFISVNAFPDAARNEVSFNFFHFYLSLSFSEFKTKISVRMKLALMTEILAIFSA